MRYSSVLVAAVVATAAMAPLSASADFNTLVIEQTNEPGDLGNTLFVDQSAATSSTVGGLVIENVLIDGMEGLTATPQSAAVQAGSGNTADITITGSGGTARLSQVGDGNDAALVLGTSLTPATGSLAIIGQEGLNNQASLTVLGTGSVGTILQTGNGNEAGLTVNGNNINAGVAQIGNGNKATDLIATGTANVQYIQIGDGLTASTAAQVTSNAVTSNGAAITIIQRSVGN